MKFPFEGKRLIIFGCGYLGLQIAEYARAKGATVSALTRNAARAEELRRLGFERVVEGTLGSDRWHEPVGGGYDFAVDCVSPGRSDPESYRTAYVDGMRSIIRWAEMHPVNAFVYTGSTGVYSQDDGGWATEQSPVAGDSWRSACLLEAERMVTPTAPGWQRGFVLRLAGLYGPGRHYLLDQVLAGAAQPEADEARPLNLIHRDDAANAVIACLERHEVQGTVFNVADNEPTPKSEVMAWLREKTGGRTGNEIDESVGRPQRRVRWRLVANGKITKILGWQPAFPSFREGYVQILGESEDPLGIKP